PSAASSAPALTSSSLYRPTSERIFSAGRTLGLLARLDQQHEAHLSVSQALPVHRVASGLRRPDTDHALLIRRTSVREIDTPHEFFSMGRRDTPALPTPPRRRATHHGAGCGPRVIYGAAVYRCPSREAAAVPAS